LETVRRRSGVRPSVGLSVSAAFSSRLTLSLLKFYSLNFDTACHCCCCSAMAVLRYIDFSPGRAYSNRLATRQHQLYQLPPHLRQCDSLGQFKRLLETRLLRPRRCVTFLLGAPCINLLTYLLTYLPKRPAHVAARGVFFGEDNFISHLHVYTYQCVSWLQIFDAIIGCMYKYAVFDVKPTYNH